MPRSGAGPAIGMPHMAATPALDCSKPATMRSSVDLPQPDAPMRQTNSPFVTIRSVLRSATTRWSCSTNSFDTFRNSMIGPPSPMLRTPAQETLPEQHHDPVRDEACKTDDDHAGDHDLGARELPRFHDERAKPGRHAGHLTDHD